MLKYMLIIFSTYCFIKSALKILSRKSNTLADYLMVIIYIFNCLPVFLDVLVGVPNYSIYPWYHYFESASNNDLVSNVYNGYILFAVILVKIYIYLQRHKKRNLQTYIGSHSRIFFGYRLFAVSLLPFILVFLFGNYQQYLVFESALRRGLSSSQVTLLMFAELLGLYAFYCWFFESKNGKLKPYWWLIVYTLLILWIDGKRYLFVTSGLMFLYFYQNSVYSKEKKIALKTLLLILLPLFGIFYIVYAISYKISPGATGTISDIMYLSFRIDFGRDDVTKFVLYRELIENAPILEYRLQTVISTIFFFIPRAIWPTKPYPHYRYLTAALYNTNVLEIPAGMTPSIFEMSIANFGVYIGIVFTPLFLLWMVKRGDKATTVPLKILYLLLLTALLTQSLDAIIIVLFLIPLISIAKRIRINRK